MGWGGGKGGGGGVGTFKIVKELFGSSLAY